MRAARLRLAALVAATLLAVAPALATTPEERLSAVFTAIEQNRFEAALREVDALIKDYPNFRLAHLVRGDLLLARARPLDTFGNVGNLAKTVPQDKIEGLRAEALARLRARRERPAAEAVPRQILQLHAGQKHAMVVDSQRSRLYVFANDGGRARLVADYYASLGKNGVDKTRQGDQKTPVGVYHVTANMPRSKLTDFYGAGAFPINYPNEWDKRQGRTGHGIWLHGTPSDVYARPPRASDGCIVLANPDFESIGQTVQVGLTPVVIADQVEWVDAAALEAERASLAGAIEQWRRDWESRDTGKYLAHYSPRFRAPKQDLAAWSAHKRTVNAAKQWIKVELGSVAMLRYPREGDFVVVSFTQDYKSDRLSNSMRKRQYWVKENGAWKILYEGAG